MKKLVAILMIAMMSMNLMACNSGKEESTAAASTEAVTEASTETKAETTEAAEPTTATETEKATEAAETEAAKGDMKAEFQTLMDTIYGVRAGTAGSSLRAEEAAPILVNFAKTYGATVDRGDLGEMATGWFNNSGAARNDFYECLSNVTDLVADQNPELQENDAYRTVVDILLITVADQEYEGMDGGDEDDAEAAMEQMKTDFANLMDAIDNIRPGSAGASLRSETAGTAMVEYAFTYGIGRSTDDFKALAETWFADHSDAKAYFQECVDAADAYALGNDDSLAEDASYQVVKSGIEAALN